MPDVFEDRNITDTLRLLTVELDRWAKWHGNVHARQATRRALQKAADWRDGAATANSDGQPRSSQACRPTEAMAGRRPSREAQLYDRATSAARTAARALADLEGFIGEIQHRPKGSDLGHAATCQACAGVVTNVAEDRLKSGLCQACYQAWRRYLHASSDPDRAEFFRHRAGASSHETNVTETAESTLHGPHLVEYGDTQVGYESCR